MRRGDLTPGHRQGGKSAVAALVERTSLVLALVRCPAPTH